MHDFAPEIELNHGSECRLSCPNGKYSFYPRLICSPRNLVEALNPKEDAVRDQRSTIRSHPPYH